MPTYSQMGSNAARRRNERVERAASTALNQGAFRPTPQPHDPGFIAPAYDERRVISEKWFRVRTPALRWVR